MTPPTISRALSSLTGAFLALTAVVSCRAQPPPPTPPMEVSADRASGVYHVGETVHWTVRWRGGDGSPAPAAHYLLKSGGLKETARGELVFRENTATIDAPFAAPNTMLLEVDWEPKGPTHRLLTGAVADWEQIQPAGSRPSDFDAFWRAKIAELKAVPINPQITVGDSGRPGVDYGKITLDNIRGTHIDGQIARPAVGRKFPALLIVQWAGVYPLQKGWVVDRARDGWLALNLEAHDIPIDNPPAYYTALYGDGGALHNYWNIGNDDRDKSYYLRMYLSCYQAIEYLKTRPDWDGKTLVVTGTSQGGQQSLMIAGLHPDNVTAAIALVPAAADMLAPQAGRASGFPNWFFNTQGKDAAKVHEASRYYDPANFATGIRCPVLVGLGLADDVAPPASIFAVLHEIKSPKEVFILAKSGHQDVNGSQAPFNRRVYSAWLPALVQGKPAPVESVKPPMQAAEPSTLRQAAAGHFLLGAAVSPRQLGDAALSPLIAAQFDSLTAENAFKPDALERERGVFTWTEADRIADFAKAHKMAMIGHCLCWHAQTGKWMYADTDGKPLPRAQALANLHDYITAVVTHFKGRVRGWDVVNEAMSDGPGGPSGAGDLRDTPARRAIGDDYIEKAFQFAHDADPDAELYYNDYSIENPDKRAKVVRLVRALKKSGCRIDAVGIQGHYSLNWPPAATLDDAIRAYAAEGVKVSFTELDIDVLPRRGQSAEIGTREAGANPYPDSCPPEVLQAQAKRYSDLFTVFTGHKGEIERITIWGVTDGQSWLNDFPVRGRTNYPLLFDRQQKPKPAYHAVIQTLETPSPLQ